MPPGHIGQCWMLNVRSRQARRCSCARLLAFALLAGISPGLLLSSSQPNSSRNTTAELDLAGEDAGSFTPLLLREPQGLGAHSERRNLRFSQSSIGGDANPANERLRNRQMEEFRPGEPWLDNEGILIQAHGGGVIYHEGLYYWFGEHKGGATYVKYSEAYSPPRVDVIGVACYSSNDLLHWKNEGLALRGGSHPDLDPANVLERPKVLYHKASKMFVMWMHVDTGDYEWARLGVAVADRVTGPYRFLRSFRPHNQQSRDLTVFQDEDESAFIAYSSEDNAVMHVARLTQDYLDVEPEYRRILILHKREAPALFKYKEYYLLLTSGCTGWAPNRAELYYSTDVLGEWQSLGNPSAGGQPMDRAYTFFSQPTFVVAVHGKPGHYVFMADQWDTENLGASRYVWLPMWVEEVPPDTLEAAAKQWQAEWLRHVAANAGSLFMIPPGPLHVVVPWMESWKPSILDQPLDAKTRQEHWRELRTNPLSPESQRGPWF